jgi:hypothetical protein
MMGVQPWQRTSSLPLCPLVYYFGINEKYTICLVYRRYDILYSIYHSHTIVSTEHGAVCHGNLALPSVAIHLDLRLGEVPAEHARP